MNKEQQIAELASILCLDYGRCAECSIAVACHVIDDAEAFYEAGCRKQSKGEWQNRKITMRAPDGKFYYRNEQTCSNCGFLNKSKKKWSSNFCPNCGARMRVDDDERTSDRYS